MPCLGGLRGQLLLGVVQRPRASRCSPCPCRSRSSRPSPSGGWPARAGGRRRARRRRARPSSPAPARAPRASRTAAPSAATVAPRALREPGRGQDVGRLLGHRDHERRHGLRAVGVGAQRHGVEHAQQLARLAAGVVLDPAPAAAPAPRSAAPGGAARRRRRSRAGSRRSPRARRPRPGGCRSPRGGSRRRRPATAAAGCGRSATWREFEVGEHELEVAPQRLRVGVARARARAGVSVLPSRWWTKAELGPQRLPLAVRAAQHRRRSAAPRRRARATRRAPRETGIRSDECENIRARRSTRVRKQPQRGRAVQRERASPACRRRPRGGRPCRRRSSEP